MNVPALPRELYITAANIRPTTIFGAVMIADWTDVHRIGLHDNPICGGQPKFQFGKSPSARMFRSMAFTPMTDAISTTRMGFSSL
jgi:hypothetical protein